MIEPAIEGGVPVRNNLLPFSPPDIHDSELKAVDAVLKSGWITSGKKCNDFETEICRYTGARHAVVLSSATAGLFLSLKVSGIGEGDEVITTPYTFAATANVILHVGAKPVFADIDPETMCISPSEIVKRITHKTRAIIPVHFAGHPSRIDIIRDIARVHNLLIVEDAAHAIGASYKGKKIGSGETITVFSFHAVKNLTTAEGGAVTTDDSELARMLRLYSLHGQTKDAYSKLREGGWRYDITVPGYKFNLTDIQAAIGIEQLKRLDDNVKKRKRIAEFYTESLRDFDFVKTPPCGEQVEHAWHLYPLLIDFSRLRIDRDGFIRALGAENISSNVHFIPVHTMSYYRERYGYKPFDFPASFRCFQREISLPIYPRMEGRDLQDVIKALKKLFVFYKK